MVVLGNGYDGKQLMVNKLNIVSLFKTLTKIGSFPVKQDKICEKQDHFEAVFLPGG